MNQIPEWSYVLVGNSLNGCVEEDISPIIEDDLNPVIENIVDVELDIFDMVSTLFNSVLLNYINDIFL
jgi:hypothetical protein